MSVEQAAARGAVVDGTPDAARSLPDDELRVILAPAASTDLADSQSSDVEAQAEAAVFPESAADGWERRLRRGLVVVDFFVLVFAVCVAGVLKQWIFDTAASDEVVAAGLVPIWLLMLLIAGAYDGWRIGSAGEEVRRVITSGLRTAGVVAIAAYGLKVPLSRAYLLLAIVAGTATLLVGRGAVRLLLHRERGEGRYVHKVVVAGHAPDVRHLVEQAERASDAGFQVVAACIPGQADWLPLDDDRRLRIMGDPVDVGTVCRSVGADVVAVASDSVLDRHQMRRLSWELEGTATRLLVAPRLTDVAGPRISVRPLSGLPLLHVEQPRFSGVDRLIKGVLDRAAAAVLLVLLLPVLLVVTIAIRVDSRGRALFSQERAGLDGTPFTCWKLRSMVKDADKRRAEVEHLNHHDNGVLFKSKDDPRVTRVGKLLRRTSVDELPQLWNVLRGEMSMVGPRPPLMNEVDAYEQDVRRRLLVKPGLTGLWQVSGRADLSWEESVRLDLFYVENWSPALDLAIIGRTVIAILTRRGAY